MSERNQATDDATVSRRRTLGMIGSGAVGVALSSGMVGAAPGSGQGQGVGPCTCGSCPDGTFCGKIDDVPEKGKTYTFGSNGDEFSVTIDDVTEEEGETTCFTFSSDDDIEKVCIKGGPDTATYTADLEGRSLCAPTNPGGQQAEISNVSFCGTKTSCYQVDLVVGEPIENLDGTTGDTYTKQERLLEAFCVCSDEDAEAEPGESSAQGCDVEWASLEFDEDSEEATVSVTLVSSESDDCEISLVGYRVPEDSSCGNNLPEQEFVTADTNTIEEGGTEQFSIPLE